MKKIVLTLVLLTTFLWLKAQNNVGIGTETPDSTAILELRSANKGLLIPRMSSEMRDSIDAPALGLLLYDTDLHQFMYYDDQWYGLSNTEDGWRLDGNSGTTAADFIGTTDSVDLKLKVNGDQVGRFNQSSVFLGTNAGNNDLGTNNIAIGRAALFYTENKQENIAIGDSALHNNGQNIVFGYEAGGNVAVGSHSLFNNDRGNDNVALGQYTMYANSLGAQNVALGSYAMYFNEVGFSNTAIGHYALSQNTAGYNNIAIGANALDKNKVGNWNVGIGVRSLLNNLSGESNTAIGMNALNRNTTGNNNAAIGRRALYNNISGELNAAVGYGAGDDHSSSRSTFLGANSASIDSLDNATAIGYEAFVDQSNQVRVGNVAVTSIGGFAGWSNLSDARTKHRVKDDVKGLDFLLRLRPVTYQYDMAIVESFAPPRKEGEVLRPSEVAAREAKGKIRYTGFLAQEVQAAAEEVNYDFSGVDAPKGNGQLYAIRYAEFVVPLVKSVQEQQSTIEELKAIIKQQNERIAALELLFKE